MINGSGTGCSAAGKQGTRINRLEMNVADPADKYSCKKVAKTVFLRLIGQLIDNLQL